MTCVIGLHHFICKHLFICQHSTLGVVRLLAILCFKPQNPMCCIMIRLTTTWRSSRALHMSTPRPGLSGASQWAPRFPSHGQELLSDLKDCQFSQGESMFGQNCRLCSTFWRLFSLLVLGVRFGCHSVATLFHAWHFWGMSRGEWTGISFNLSSISCAQRAFREMFV